MAQLLPRSTHMCWLRVGGRRYVLAVDPAPAVGDGSALAIIKDNTFSSFKMANIGAPFGTLDQDRLAGIRADLTRTPALTPIRSTIRNLDNGNRRRGQTLGADRDSSCRRSPRSDCWRTTT